MAERNPHSSWGDNTIGVAFREQLRKSKEAKDKVVPFGEERLTPAEGRERLKSMSQEERQRFIASKGESEILKMLRG